MSKRQISHQQSHRIYRKQTRYQEQATSATPESLSEGLVIKRFSRLALIEDSQGHRLRCSIRPDIHSLVAGDRVIWQPEGHHQGVVLSVLPRQSVLNRPDYRGILKPVAANITQVLIVVAPIPEISWTLLDSYLVMTESLQLQTCIVLNKTDIDSPLQMSEAHTPTSESTLAGLTIREQLSAIYQPLGYTILPLSRENKSSYVALMKILNGQTSVFVGQSGVGKSSIISCILPEQMDIQISEVSESSNLGRHTTSNSCLYHLANGGHLIDSPGVREFGLWDMPVRNIAEGFREFRPYSAQCQFRNCNHQNTPGCAVIQALHEGKIHQNRYHSYIKLALKFL